MVVKENRNIKNHQTFVLRYQLDITVTIFSKKVIFPEIMTSLITLSRLFFKNSCNMAQRERKIFFYFKVVLSFIVNRSSHRRCSIKKAVLKNFVTFTGSHLCWSLLLIKLQAWSSATLLKETPKQVFSCEYYEMFKNSFFIEHLWLLLLKSHVNFEWKHTVVILINFGTFDKVIRKTTSTQMFE